MVSFLGSVMLSAHDCFFCCGSAWLDLRRKHQMHIKSWKNTYRKSYILHIINECCVLNWMSFSVTVCGPVKVHGTWTDHIHAYVEALLDISTHTILSQYQDFGRCTNETLPSCETPCLVFKVKTIAPSSGVKLHNNAVKTTKVWKYSPPADVFWNTGTNQDSFAVRWQTLCFSPNTHSYSFIIHTLLHWALLNLM